jgi:hypothetical protein
MTVHAPITMTKDAFLAWVERREERYEFSEGRVTMMVNVTRNHAQVTTKFGGCPQDKAPERVLRRIG